MSVADESQSADERPLPQNPDAERAVLGALLGENTDAGFVLGMLHPGDFFLDPHKVIFSTLHEIREEGDKSDLLLLEERLRSAQKLDAAGGIAYLAQLALGMSSPSNVKFYAQVVREKAELRGLIHMASAIQKRAVDGEPAAILRNEATQLSEMALQIAARLDEGFSCHSDENEGR